jgi:hypothetical protein
MGMSWRDTTINGKGENTKMENGKGKMAINGFPSWKFGSPAADVSDSVLVFYL